MKRTFNIVAQIPRKSGTKNPSVFNDLLKIPPKQPSTDLRRQFNPIGQALKKSKNKPETKPVVSPIIFPLFIEKNKTQIKDKSGKAGRKTIFERTAASKTETQSRMAELEKKARNIFSPNNKASFLQAAACHLNFSGQQQAHFPSAKNLLQAQAQC